MTQNNRSKKVTPSVWQEQVYSFKAKRTRIPKATRQEVLRRDNYSCARCDCSQTTCRLTVHHILPSDEGGGDNVENLIALCIPCHDLVERVGFLRTRELLRSGPAPSPPPKPLAEEDDWRTWVYGGARNPLQDI